MSSMLTCPCPARRASYDRYLAGESLFTRSMSRRMGFAIFPQTLPRLPRYQATVDTAAGGEHLGPQSGFAAIQMEGLNHPYLGKASPSQPLIGVRSQVWLVSTASSQMFGGKVTATISLGSWSSLTWPAFSMFPHASSPTGSGSLTSMLMIGWSSRMCWPWEASRLANS